MKRRDFVKYAAAVMGSGEVIGSGETGVAQQTAVHRPAETPAGTSSRSILELNQKQLLVKVDVRNCRWSAHLKGTGVKLENIYFLDGDNPHGWSIKARVNHKDENPLGSFDTVTLHGTQKGRLDFDYHISAGKTGNDILVRLDRANNTGAPVEIADMDYMVAEDARLGGTNDKWLSFGTKSVYSEYYDLTLVRDFPVENRGEYRRPRKMYEVCHLVRNVDMGNLILIGHLTVNKGHSRLEVGRKDAADSMRMRAYCTYGVTMPPGRSFVGEKLLLHLGGDGLRALEHLGDLIGLANDIRLRQKRPLDLDDKALIAFTHVRWVNYSSGGTAPGEAKFMYAQHLDKFFYGGVQGGGGFLTGDSHSHPEYGASGEWALTDAGGTGRKTDFPDECYLAVNVPRTNGKVLDFSNPVCVEVEKQRVARIFAGKEAKTNLGEVDYSVIWDKWPGQHDPFMSAVETWHAGAAPWRDFIDSKSPRMRNHSCMTKLDFNYGYIDLARISEDDDGMHVPDAYAGGCDIRGPGHRGFLGECVPGAAMRFFYNGRVFWNDGNISHVYKYQGGRIQPYDQAKVTLNFKSIATNCTMIAEAGEGTYPEDRIELLKRVSPPTPDVAYPVDLFERKRAAVWNLPVERPFGKWNILGVFNYGPKSPDLSVTLDAEKDLRLDPKKEYVVYEFWSRKLLGTFQGKFVSQVIHNKDCDIYSIVEKQQRPVLLSTSRHVRQMAFDIKQLFWDSAQNHLSGVSRAIEGDPYQLRVFVPAAYRFDRVEMPTGLTVKTHAEGDLLLVDYTTPSDDDVAWGIRFSRDH